MGTPSFGASSTSNFLNCRSPRYGCYLEKVSIHTTILCLEIEQSQNEKETQQIITKRRKLRVCFNKHNNNLRNKETAKQRLRTKAQKQGARIPDISGIVSNAVSYFVLCYVSLYQKTKIMFALPVPRLSVCVSGSFCLLMFFILPNFQPGQFRIHRRSLLFFRTAGFEIQIQTNR